VNQPAILPLLLALVLLWPVRAGQSILESAVEADTGSPVLLNPGFECGDGYHDQPGIHGMVPNGWTASILNGKDLFMASTQMWATMGCDPADLAWEKLEGHDSNIFMANYAPYGQDFSAPPFDVVLYQEVTVTPDTPYSLSAWMTSLCGGSATPSDCPQGAYIAKMAGLDPAGGVDPTAQSVVWTEDRRPHTEARWTNLVLVTTAQGSNLTVFIRANSPFQHRGNHVFADAVKLVRAPSSLVTSLEARENSIGISWAGALGPDIAAIPAGNYRLTFEVQVRSGAAPWQSWLTNQDAGGAMFTTPPSCRDQTYRFRLRSMAQQIPGQKGAWPDHRFVGVWTESTPVTVPHAVNCSPKGYLPMASG
jgi:hypothetical protein